MMKTSIITPKKILYSAFNKTIKGYSSSAFLQKRIIDITFSCTLLILTSPLILYTIYRIRKESPGSILFKQARVGLNGKIFTCYKFRSMYINSDFNPYTQDEDSRIFPFGLTMRKMRIDELPQLWNVLKGDMHLIGPRAEWDILVKEYEQTIQAYHRRHIVRPGITGLAQVLYPYGRGIEDTKKKLKYDLIYIKKWSIAIELKIIWQTILVILAKKGV